MSVSFEPTLSVDQQLALLILFARHLIRWRETNPVGTAADLPADLSHDVEWLLGELEWVGFFAESACLNGGVA